MSIVTANKEFLLATKNDARFAFGSTELNR